MHWDVGNNSKFACEFTSVNQIILSSIYNMNRSILGSRWKSGVVERETGVGTNKSRENPSVDTLWPCDYNKCAPTP